MSVSDCPEGRPGAWQQPVDQELRSHIVGQVRDDLDGLALGKALEICLQRVTSITSRRPG